jgi:glutathione S-transferase
MRLRYTTGSPFARAVRIVMDEKGLDYERIEEITTTAAEVRAADAPTLQVPALRDGETRLWDSLVIIEYLIRTYPGTAQNDPPFSDIFARSDSEIADRQQLATLQTLGVSAATISQLKWSGVGIQNDFTARNAERIGYLLDWAEHELGGDGSGFQPGTLCVQDILLACPLMFLENRPLGIDWRAGARTHVAALVDMLSERASFRNNPIWWWEPGVTGYSADGTPLFGDGVAR